MMNIRNKIALTALAGTLVTSQAVLAQESNIMDKLGATIGASYEYGRLSGDDTYGHEGRSMSALSFEFLPGYRLNSKWLVGVDFNYRIQEQLTSRGNSGGTDLEGKGWLLGLGAQYRINSEWAIQGAVDLVGKYSLDKKPTANQDDDLSRPLSLRLKGQYFFAEQWTADLSTNYIKWGKFENPGTNYEDSVTQWMVGVGITYHFGNINSTPESKPVIREEVKNDSQEKVSILLDSKKTDTGFKLNLPSVAFAAYKVDLSNEFKTKIKEAGVILSKYPNQKIRIEGYTDTSGNENQNISLSKARAESVRKALIESGVKSSSISSNGFGSKNPIATNTTVKGRAKNRRVELFVDQQ